MTSFGVTPMTGLAGLATKASNQLCQRCMSLNDCSGYVVANTCAVAIFLPSRSLEMRHVRLLMRVRKNYARPLAEQRCRGLLSQCGIFLSRCHPQPYVHSSLQETRAQPRAGILFCLFSWHF